MYMKREKGTSALYSRQCDTMTLSIVISPYLFVRLAYASNKCSQCLTIWVVSRRKDFWSWLSLCGTDAIGQSSEWSAKGATSLPDPTLGLRFYTAALGWKKDLFSTIQLPVRSSFS